MPSAKTNTLCPYLVSWTPLPSFSLQQEEVSRPAGWQRSDKNIWHLTDGLAERHIPGATRGGSGVLSKRSVNFYCFFNVNSSCEATIYVQDRSRGFLLPPSAVFRLPTFAHLPSSFIIISFLSSSICFVQSTRLESKTSTPAWPPLSLSTAALTPSRVGPPSRSEGTLRENRKRFSFFSERFFSPTSDFCLLCLFNVSLLLSH